MLKKQGQSTIEYLILVGAVITFLIFFLATGFQETLKKIFGKPPSTTDYTIITNTRLDVYKPWPSSGIYLGNFNATNVVGWNPGCDTSRDTCHLSIKEPNNPPVGMNQYCYPGKDYDCHEAWCWGGKTLEFDKHCRTAATLIDTCTGSDEFAPYQCQPNDNFTCNDVAVDIGCLAADVPGGCWNGIGAFARQRTVTCKPIIIHLN